MTSAIRICYARAVTHAVRSTGCAKCDGGLYDMIVTIGMPVTR